MHPLLLPFLFQLLELWVVFLHCCHAYPILHHKFICKLRLWLDSYVFLCEIGLLQGVHYLKSVHFLFLEEIFCDFCFILCQSVHFIIDVLSDEMEHINELIFFYIESISFRDINFKLRQDIFPPQLRIFRFFNLVIICRSQNSQ